MSNGKCRQCQDYSTSTCCFYYNHSGIPLTTVCDFIVCATMASEKQREAAYQLESVGMFIYSIFVACIAACCIFCIACIKAGNFGGLTMGMPIVVSLCHDSAREADRS